MVSKSCCSTLIKDDDADDAFQRLPKEMYGNGLMVIGCYKGFWFPQFLYKNLMSMHKHFEAKDTDIILATLPKSGTTWLKALSFSIINRNKYSITTHPLLHSNPHQLVPFIETEIYNESTTETMKSSPAGIFATHVPYECLPLETIINNSDCKIVYLARNLLDVVNSGRHFTIENEFYSASNYKPLIAMDDCVERVIEGKHPYGPFCNQMLGYWNASLRNPQKVLFLKYEDLTRDTIPFVMKIADFLGYPFTRDEEESGLVQEITNLCSFENLKSLEVNMVGKVASMNNAKTSSLFRQGKVGDWKNHLSPSMAERLQNLMQEKFSGSGLTWEIL